MRVPERKRKREEQSRGKNIIHSSTQHNVTKHSNQRFQPNFKTEWKGKGSRTNRSQRARNRITSTSSVAEWELAGAVVLADG